MHEKNIALLCDEADRLLQLNINLLRQMVEEPDVLSDSKNENRLLFDKQKALKRIEELEGEQIKTARREMVLAVVGTMKAGKSTTINAIVGQEILPNRNRPMTSVPTLIRHVPGKTEPVLHLEHIQPVRNLLITLQEKLATPAGQQVAQTLQQIGDTAVLHARRRDRYRRTRNFSFRDRLHEALFPLCYCPPPPDRHHGNNRGRPTDSVHS